ncbi:4-(cytidine 5'-diphospho)-2-C-methyl-D-erythritol kinase [Gammaproteobacteria bacterium]|nr:4-(cytidine 5'-diphospho)-2-C-methyl-D-erythritol kinase [Gammaproteobacteria bacterium]
MSLYNSTFSPAKINLYLKVNNKRSDGFHNIESRFQLINLFDEITIKKTNNKNISLKSNIKNKSFLNKNIILDTCFKLQEAVGEDLGCEVTVIKNIPVGAGLGGGSSNAASTLVGLNNLFKFNLSHIKLAQLGAELGADIPFFISGKNANVSGFGEILSPCDSINSKILLIYPNIHVSTKEMFDELQAQRIIQVNEKISDKHNDFQDIFNKKFPVISDFFSQSEEEFNLEFNITGTGSSHFCLYKNELEISEFIKKIPNNWRFFNVEPLQYSPINDN